jgi:hypothetical protein
MNDLPDNGHLPVSESSLAWTEAALPPAWPVDDPRLDRWTLAPVKLFDLRCRPVFQTCEPKSEGEIVGASRLSRPKKIPKKPKKPDR